MEYLDYTNLHFDSSLTESRIFIADDTGDLWKYISNTLSQFLNVEVFVSGKEFLDVIEDDLPDFVLSDVLMPELNGFELCKRIKSEIKTSHISVVFINCLYDDWLSS